MPPPAWAVQEAADALKRAQAAHSLLGRSHEDAEAAQATLAPQSTLLKRDREDTQASDAGLRRPQLPKLAAAPAARAPVPSHSVPVQWQDWPCRSGESELTDVLRRRSWSDGQPFRGKGHTRPYLQGPYARAISERRKTVEGRPFTGWAAAVRAGDYVTFNITASGKCKLCCRVLRVRRFATFDAMLEACGLHACLPDFVGRIASGAQLYRGFGSSGGTYAELEAKYGVVGIDVVPLAQ